MDKFIIKGEKKLRYGYTTGSCAAAATKAGLTMLFSGEKTEHIDLHTPKGWNLHLEVVDIKQEENSVSCAIIKDSGDDPDMTNGISIYSKVSFTDVPGIVLSGGIGVGVVTRKGLPVPVGQAAINPVPREMILSETRALVERYKYLGGLHIQIYTPQGEEIAKRTFNPKLGIVNGISILGTTGIVEPMSEKALIDSLKLEMNVLSANNKENIILFPGNYGRKFANEDLRLNIKNSVKISNYIGEILESIDTLRFKNVLFVAHIGKLIKVAGGIMNTHSKSADARMEILGAYTSACGGDSQLTKDILHCITTDEAIELLIHQPFYEEVLDKILERVSYHMNSKISSYTNIGLIMFTNTHGILRMDEKAKQMLHLFRD
ncbi:cobalamin biosynthesis protein CbiD [Alkalibaculum sp. M08DMB]|uniref:Cobalt-precorrin-5B C(1)-methyltransferase n=1 Tax=Alkalibaculum sporogenes TaxID=2655001 RepID=A0A6A7KB92_9FIRM|nr:cobalt-precorrin-5B (C(1))-methyltransferase CbiD [Alkalibaculum sporogenes]MPW26283.1 cobalamin biosynthesis protein CbiD [Alkalibaculum sporogenes]